MNEEKKKLLKSLVIPSIFILILFAIEVFQKLTGMNLIIYGLYPRKISGLIGILAAPLLHVSYAHLISNSIPLLLVGVGVSYFYPSSANKIFISIYLIPGVFVWFTGRPAYHVGASGIDYGLVTFLFFSGLIRRDTRSIALALIVTLLYGSLIWGIFPQNDGISWEYHLFGSLTGIFCAIIFRKSDAYKKYDWEDEEETDEVN